MTTNNHPIHHIKLGRIKAAIYENASKNGLFYGVQISRTYRVAAEERTAQDNGWRSTASFSRDDLPRVAKLVDLAHSWTYQSSLNEAPSNSTE